MVTNFNRNNLIQLNWNVFFNVIFQEKMQFFLKNSSAQSILFTCIDGVFSLMTITFLLHLSVDNYKTIGPCKQEIAKQFLLGISFGLALFILNSIILGPIIQAPLPNNTPEGVE